MLRIFGSQLFAGALLAPALCMAACDGGPRLPFTDSTLVINEVMTDNEGACIDSAGEADDYVELFNAGDEPIALSAYTLSDKSGKRGRLPQRTLAPGETVLLFADGTPEQGPLHLPFKLSAAGDRLLLRTALVEIDSVQIPPLEPNQAYLRLPNAHGEFVVCRYASPGRNNGDRCGPPAPPELTDSIQYRPYTWPERFGAPAGPLVLAELALKPAAFVELLNAGDHDLDLAEYSVRVQPHAPGVPWPGPTDGHELAFAEPLVLAPGERKVVDVSDADVAALAPDPAFEGVVSVFETASGRVSDRIDFMHWPQDAALIRVPDASGPVRFCAAHTPGEANDPCDALPERDVGDRLRQLTMPSDFAALSDGDTSLNLRGVKFVIDMQAGDVVHFLSSRDWALHYTFVREQIDHAGRLDRCDPAQSAAFDAGWYAFSQSEYLRTEGRRYLLGTLDVHAGSALPTVDFTLGDQISAEQMRHAFFTVMARVDMPSQWSLRPSEPRQEQELLRIDGEAPIVGQNAPFQGVRFQPLTPGVGFGVLRFIPASELERTAIGRDTIVVTDDVPNDIPLVGGLVTEAFQTPLAHVNVLSRNRGTPNMALRDARDADELVDYFDRLVRIEVSAAGFNVREATAAEAAAWLEERAPAGGRIAPRLDLSVRGVQPLSGQGLEQLPSIGAKAAQQAELHKVAARCGAPVPVPTDAFAIPVVHYVEHFERSGARALLAQLEQRPEFRGDPAARAEGLAEVQRAIRDSAVDPDLLRELEAAIFERFGEQRVRLRSSSNTEDLPAFNGAGLYLSLSVALHDEERAVADGLREVWSSLWSLRAYDERELANIDQTQVAMGVLVHESFLSERANAVAISRNVLDPTRSDIHYINAQFGEASVVDPAPGVVTEQFIHHYRLIPGTPEVEYQSRSSLVPGKDVLSLNEVRQISCQLHAIHDHFRAKLDPAHENPWFAVDIELKLVGQDRRLLIKQARPYSFGEAELPTDCRET